MQRRGKRSVGFRREGWAGLVPRREDVTRKREGKIDRSGVSEKHMLDKLCGRQSLKRSVWSVSPPEDCIEPQCVECVTTRGLCTDPQCVECVTTRSTVREGRPLQQVMTTIWYHQPVSTSPAASRSPRAWRLNCRGVAIVTVNTESDANQ